MSGWIETSLENVTDLITRGIPPKYIEDGGVCVVNQRCIREHKIDYETARRHCINTKAVQKDRYIRVGDVLINSTGVGTLGRVAQVREEPKEPTVVDTHVTILRPQSGLFHPDFLGFLLISLEEQLMGLGEGASGQTELSRTKIKQLKVSFPKSLSEQKRIVEILDEAFDGIAKATANAQRNLANAKELFSETLRHSFSDQSGWKNFQLGEKVTFVDYRGKTPPKRETGVRLITAKNVKMGFIQREPEEFIDASVYDGWMTRCYPQNGDVLFTTEAPLGNVAQLYADERVVIGQRLITMKSDPNFLISDFLKWLLMSPQAQCQIWSLATGATVQGIKAKLLKTVQLATPNIEKQKELAARLEQAWDDTKNLECNYREKLSSLLQLKQSLLHKAFTGQLTSSSVVPAVQKLESPMTANAKLTAQVIVLAHYRHTAARRDKTFGHVKEQKILHLVESCANVPLGRAPIKDAAGPNDFAHMLRAEEWAESNGFFKVTEHESGYSFQKLMGYDQLLSEAQERLKPFKQRLDKILDLLIPMNSQEAEVFATVHAAWNNLVVDKKPVTDDAIVKEARDNWHPDKLKIPREKFLKAIRLIRKEGLIPDGSAKAVRHLQGKLL